MMTRYPEGVPDVPIRRAQMHISREMAEMLVEGMLLLAIQADSDHERFTHERTATLIKNAISQCIGIVVIDISADCHTIFQEFGVPYRAFKWIE